LRVLVVASHFPRPTNPTMGVWALRQAQALRRRGIELEVIAMCDWIPRPVAAVANVPLLSSRAQCPPVSTWDGLTVHHPRWPRYHRGPHATFAFAHPGLELSTALAFSERSIRAIAASFGPDLIYAHGSVVNGEIGRRLVAATPRPLVSHDHDYDEIRACARLPARRRHLARVYAACDEVIAVSRAMRADIGRIFPGTRTSVLPNGADPDPVPRAARRDPPTVLCVAGFYPRKRIPLLVEAFALVSARRPDAWLEIVGDGAERPQVEATIERLGLGDRVRLLGLRPHEQALEAMRRAAVFALLADDDPFSVAYMEALAAGTPIVCTDQAGVTDEIQDGVQGRIVEHGRADAAAAAILELLDSQHLRERMGSAGRKLIERRLSWDAHAEAVEQLFESALNRRQGGNSQRVAR
jgi:glycosyltransferase involved in cell wall biosynthesis